MKKFSFIFLSTLAFASYGQDCPGILVTPFTDEVVVGDTIIFTATTNNLKSNVTYKWAINKGTIIFGQGTAQIKITTVDNESGEWITAAVRLVGLPAGCKDTATSFVEMVSSSQLVVSGTFNNGSILKNAVQQFIVSTFFIEPEYTHTSAFVYLYRGASTTKGTMQTFKDVIKNTFEANKVDAVRFQIVEGPPRRLTTYEIYLLEKGAKAPPPSK